MSNLFSLPLPVIAALSGFFTSFVALLLFAAIRARGPNIRGLGGSLQFEGRALVASDGKARRAFHDSQPIGDDWDRAVALLDAVFPGLDREKGPMALSAGRRRSPVSGECLDVRRDGSLVTLSILPATGGKDVAEGVETAEPCPEIDALRAATQLLPFPVWMLDRDGGLAWANASYVSMAAELHPGADPDIWPPPPLFDAELLPADMVEGASVRVPLVTEAGVPRQWFDVHARRTGERTLYAAANADDAVRAERNLRDFTQTLTKTFAHLTVGLAIFDQSRRLVLFNPALADMTGLPPDVLAARPTLVGFLDRLRDRRIIPEPKDYGSWRRKMAELEAAAVDGTYAETWSLPTGQTYRVTGQPHPDGAVIFLFEDISAEISLTRRFRAELEMGQAVVDSMDEAIAAFTPDGVLCMTNAAYSVLWDHEPETELSRMSVAEATSLWLARTAPTPVWGDFRDFVHLSQNRVEWNADVILRDGRCLACRFAPLAGGGTVARFRQRAAGDLRAETGQRQTA